MRSMTAYASVEEQSQQGKIKIALRSLNFKYLDVSFYNLPQQAFALEESMRQEIKKNVTRGKVEVYFYQSGAKSGQFQINKKEFSNYAKQLKKLSAEYGLSKAISPLEIMSLPGVVSTSGGKNFSKTKTLSVLKKSLQKLVKFKEEKGKAIKKELLESLSMLEANIRQIKKERKQSAEEDEAKEDIAEEVALIGFYSKKLKQAINSKRQLRKGKELDFLSQEILRELNASASKTRKKSLANLIVGAKNYLGRIREQAQNIE